MTSTEMWGIVQLLRKTKGTKAKKEILKAAYPMAEVLYYTYNPFLQYGVAAPKHGGYGGNNFTEHTFELLDKLALNTLSGNEAKNKVKAQASALDYGSFHLFRGIINKSLDIGLAARSINEIFPDLIPEHAIQLAKPVDWKHVEFPCYISPKLDGLRAVYKKGKFYSRKGHELQGLTDLARQAEIAFEGKTLDGELMVPGFHFNEISGKIRSFKETPEAVYHVFDMPNFDGVFSLRYGTLNTIFERTHGKHLCHNIFLVDHHYVVSQKDAIKSYEQYKSQGYEGAMLKSPNGLYENARTWAWQKMKNTDTADCKVIGMFEGQGKYEGLVGGIYVDFNGVKVGVGSGLTDAQRIMWADEPEEIIGKTVEVAYQEITPDGSLRHPRLVNIRGDK